MAERIIKAKTEEQNPPFFCSELTEEDKRVLLANNVSRSFDTEFVIGVAARCKSGYPQVLVCAPFMSDGTPFPTLFWLSCPYLDKRCAELETEHKIPLFEHELEAKKEDVKKWHEEYAAIRKSIAEKSKNDNVKNFDKIMESFDKTGVGGINRIAKPCTAKCLHLQTATMLAWKHPAADWLKRELGCTECNCSICKTSENN